jgi:hypothetical protein
MSGAAFKVTEYFCQLRKKLRSRRLMRCHMLILCGGPGYTTTFYETIIFDQRLDRELGWGRWLAKKG